MSRIEALEPRVLCARSDTVIDTAWRFEKSDVAGASAAVFDDARWGKVTLPHSWNATDAQDGGSNYYRGPAWYRKAMLLDETYAAKRTFFRFDGASLVAKVYFNGALVAQHKGGYAGFTVDVTPWVQPGAVNVLAVRVDNGYRADVAPLQADFNVFGGIYRDVHLITTDLVHVNLLDSGSPGVFLTPTKVTAASAKLQVLTEVRNDARTVRRVTVVTTLRDSRKKVLRTLVTAQRIPGRSTMNVVQATRLFNPKLWNGRTSPYRYKVNVHVSDDKGSVDDSPHTVGFRSFAVSPSQGFFLNGQPYDLHGVGFHQDRQDRGPAISDADVEQDMSLIDEIGATAARVSHYQHRQSTFDYMDRTGIVAWAEIPLLNLFSTSAAFTDNARLQLREMIRQNYNHPSILFWGIFNELDDVPGANELVMNLDTLAAEEDPTRVTVSATDLSDQDPLNWRTDLAGFNKYYGWYYGHAEDIGAWADRIHIANPKKKIAISEYGAGGSINQHEYPTWQPAHGGTHHPEEYLNEFHEASWNAIKDKPFLWAKFAWSMFDFASDSRSEGDAMGRNDKGLVTYDRKTKKDAFYWYKANWSSDPFTYITSRRFTQRSAASTEVKVYTNTGNATLKINGVTIGSQTSSEKALRWNVKLSPGANLIEISSTLKGITYTDSCTWNLATNNSATSP